MQNETKINTLLQKWPKNTVAVYSWLENNGISKSLAEYYRKSGWLESFGRGAFIRKGDDVNEFSALFTLQNHLKLPIHIGGISALVLSGYSHYIKNNQHLQIFNKYGSPIPSWFKNGKHFRIQILNTNFLSENKHLLPNSINHYNNYHKLTRGLMTLSHNTENYALLLSSPERALLEVLYLCPKKFDLTEAFHLAENLVSLRPKVMQELLEDCHSIKVKRLACFIFEKIGHEWFKHLDLSKINFGKGSRKIVGHGAYDSKFKIIIPKNLKNGDGATI